MEILFKSNDRIFFIKDDELYDDYIRPIYKPILDEVPHIDNNPIIYHCHGLPAYYEYKNKTLIKSIINDEIFGIVSFEEKDKDYTQVNIIKILNGNII